MLDLDASPLSHLTGAAARILEIQDNAGAIPWFRGSAWDAWNHGECVMALGVMGEHAAAQRGLDCLAARQNADGSWLSEYGAVLPMADDEHVAREGAPAFHDTNMSAYCAVVVWHRWKLTGDSDMVRQYWPMVRAAMNFVLRLQRPEGDILWSVEGPSIGKDDALLAGNCSILKSLACAIRLAIFNDDELAARRYTAARVALHDALIATPEAFDRAGDDRSGFAMDWYYPVLGGALEGEAATTQLKSRWAEFVEDGAGCRCVSFEPWATIAESAELVMACLRADLRTEAEQILKWQNQWTDETGAYWMGWQFEQRALWPMERPSWTQAAVILATDALHQVTPAATLLLE